MGPPQMWFCKRWACHFPQSPHLETYPSSENKTMIKYSRRWREMPNPAFANPPFLALPTIMIKMFIIDMINGSSSSSSKNIYIYIYIYTHTCIYIYIYIYISGRITIWLRRGSGRFGDCAGAQLIVVIYIYTYIYSLSLSMYMYISMCVYIYIYIYIYSRKTTGTRQNFSRLHAGRLPRGGLLR